MKRVLFVVVGIILSGRFAAAIGGPYSILSGEIVRIDTWYQTTTPIGGDSFNGAAIEYSEDGFLYGVDPFLDTLMRIDPSTGTAETVGPMGVDIDWDADLDEDDEGRLWILEGSTGKLYQIDRISGAASLHCQSSNSYLGGLVILSGRMYTTTYYPDPPDPGCGLEYIGASAYASYLERGPEGWIHGLRYYALGQSTGHVFFRINPTTGVEEELGRFVYFWDSLYGLTFAPVDQLPPAIPTLGWQGRAMLILLLAIAGAAILAHFSTGRR
jgi:hypothetical protein